MFVPAYSFTNVAAVNQESVKAGDPHIPTLVLMKITVIWRPYDAWGW